MIRALIFISLFTLSCAHAAQDDSDLQDLPMSARQAITKWNFKFKLFKFEEFIPDVQDLFEKNNLAKVAPMRVAGDYNGDKVEDFALLGEAGKQQYCIVALSGKKWKIVEVRSWSDPKFKSTEIKTTNATFSGIPTYLTKAAGSLPESYKKKTNREAIQLEAYLGAVELFKIENDKALELKP